jgi:hypothetical protein
MSGTKASGTKAGRAFFAAFAPFLRPSLMQEADIERIEAEAREQERERIAAAVRALPEHGTGHGIYVWRAAVLAAITERSTPDD